MAQSLIITATALLLAWLKWGIKGQFIALAVGGAVFNATLIWKGTRQYPGVLGRAVRQTYDKSATAELWKLNTPTYVLNLCGRISLLTDNIVVAAILGPVLVVPLILTQKLPALAQAAFQGLGAASLAGLSQLPPPRDQENFHPHV